jgi:hypothetical protein
MINATNKFNIIHKDRLCTHISKKIKKKLSILDSGDNIQLWSDIKKDITVKSIIIVNALIEQPLSKLKYSKLQPNRRSPRKLLVN